jgi:hypothetical protein
MWPKLTKSLDNWKEKCYLTKYLHVIHKLLGVRKFVYCSMLCIFKYRNASSCGLAIVSSLYSDMVHLNGVPQLFINVCFSRKHHVSIILHVLSSSMNPSVTSLGALLFLQWPSYGVLYVSFPSCSDETVFC